MSQKREKFKPIKPVARGTKKQPKEKDDFIVSDEDISEEKPKMKRLKKITKIQEQEAFLPEEEKSQSQFQDSFQSEESVKKEKGNKKLVQTSITSMFNSNKKQNSKKKFQKFNVGKTDQQAFEEAIKMSLSMKDQEMIPEFKEQRFPKKIATYQFKNEEIKEEKKRKNQSERKHSNEKRHSNEKKKKTPQSKKKEKKQGVFSGEHVVLTGQFSPYSKMQIVQLLESLGADCPKTLAKKTTYLLQGSYVIDAFKRKTADDAKQTAKSRQAEKRGNIKIIANEDIDLFFIQFTGKSLQELMGDGPKPQLDERPLLEMISEDTVMIADQMWIDKYKPKHLDEIIGQQAQIKSLREWIECWEDIHIRGNKRDVKGSFNSFRPAGNINSKAALISGDPGIGKSTAAKLLAAQYNYRVVQFNASDVRNKKSVNLLQNKNNLGLSKGKTLEKVILLMDEVDGMSSGDRGGITSMIALIKSSKIPIICVCNDRDSQKIKTLGGYCNDIKFHKPDKRLIVKRLTKIIELQGGKSSQQGLQRIVQIFQNDIRQILSYLEIFFRTISKNIVYQTVDKHKTQAKDISVLMNFFQATKQLLNRLMFKGLKIRERINISFIDSDFVPLMCQENYLSSASKKPIKTASEFHQIVKATEGFVEGDLLNKRIRKDQNWILMPNMMFNQCVYPAEMISQSLGFPKFTNFLGKLSSEKKTKRVAKQMKYMLARENLVTIKSIKYQYAPLMFYWLYQKLKEGEIEEIVRFMDYYHISPTIITEHLQSLQLGDRQSLMKDISASTKAKLTRAYNKYHENTKFKKKKTITTEDFSKYDPVLGEFQNLKLDDDEQQEEQQEIVEKKKKKK